MGDTHTGRVNCQACGKQYRWKAELAGRKVRCSCGQVMVMPQADPAEASEGASADLFASPAASARMSSCPSCHAPVKAEAVICVQCGYNLREGRQIKTQTGGVVRAATGDRAAPRRVTTPQPDGFFGKLARSWEFAKMSYGILWDFKQLILFPIFSTLASIVVLASFLLPLWGTGTLEELSLLLDQDRAGEVSPLTYVVLFIMYFCSYFTIVFFNTALTACAMKVTAGEAPSVGYGLSVAMKRLPQIVAWALLSAVVGTALRAIENLNEKAGRIIAAVLGTAWTVLTYFVVPVLCVEGVGPFTALKRSIQTLKSTWGEGLLGNVSMGLLSFLLILPIYALIAVGLFVAVKISSLFLGALVIAVGVLLIILHAAASSAANGVFRALLYNYATGRSMPADIDEDIFAHAFASRPQAE